MAAKKGFTLIEILVALVIVGVGAAVTIPNLMTAQEQTNAQTARNNLYAISAAQANYFSNNSVYCQVACGTTAGINTNLHLSIWSGDTFTYSCNAPGAPYSCQAIDTAKGGTDTITLTVTPLGVSVGCTTTGSAGNCPF